MRKVTNPPDQRGQILILGESAIDELGIFRNLVLGSTVHLYDDAETEAACSSLSIDFWPAERNTLLGDPKPYPDSLQLRIGFRPGPVLMRAFDKVVT